MKKIVCIKSVKGLTLLELLLCLSLMILLIGFVVGGWAKLRDHREEEIMTSQLLQSLRFAKQAAMAKQQQVTLCPAENDDACGNNWSHGWLIFVDPDNQGQPGGENHILLRQPAFHAKLTLSFSGWLHHAYVRFAADGAPRSYHGTFFIEDRPIIVINAAGRIREAGES